MTDRCVRVCGRVAKGGTWRSSFASRIFRRRNCLWYQDHAKKRCSRYRRPSLRRYKVRRHKQEFRKRGFAGR